MVKRYNRRRGLSVRDAFIIMTVCILVSCGSPTYRTEEGSVWNTVYHITYKADRDLVDSVQQVMKHVEMSLSPFNEASLVSRVNRGDLVEVDSLFERVFTMSVAVNRASGGAFDPTVAPIVNLWGFGYRNSDGEPSPEAIDSAMSSVGIRDCRLSGGFILKKTPATEFNFSAITKGMGCDLIGEMFRRNGITDYMIEIGGEIALSGTNPRGEKWRIMIDAPLANDTTVQHQSMAVIQPQPFAGIATSGNYRNFHETSSGRVGHTVSPLTGRPVMSEILSVTVLASSAMTADALSTACMAMQLNDALKMIEQWPEAEALIVTARKDGDWEMLRTSGFPAAN